MLGLSRRKAVTVAASGAAIAVMIGLVAYSPTLYRMFCAATGYGGTVRRAIAVSPKEKAVAAKEELIKVRFDANVGNGLKWRFEPAQREVEVHLGEPKQIYYTATNLSDKTVVAHAVYNITPFKAGPYFFKIQCFCFTNERLGPGQSAKMPVVFYVDDQLFKDRNTREVRTITLSYTFYAQTDLSPEEVSQARDLAEGSKALEAKLARSKKASFSNDASVTADESP